MPREELEIVTSLDQEVSVVYQDVLDEVESTISLAVQDKDVEIAFAFCRRMKSQIKRSGLALAKALWMIEKNWVLRTE